MESRVRWGGAEGRELSASQTDRTLKVLSFLGDLQAASFSISEVSNAIDLPEVEVAEVVLNLKSERFVVDVGEDRYALFNII